jgi:hypothetical protein
MQKELTGNNPQQMLFAEEITMTETLYPPNSTRQEIEEKFKNSVHEELKLDSMVSYMGKKNVPFPEKELEKWDNENLKIVEGVYNALINDEEIQKQIARLKEHEWVKVVEGENEQSRI